MAGRPPKLSEEIWNRIRDRLLAGESYGNLAKEYKVSKGAISARFSGKLEPLKELANQMVNSELQLMQLPINERRSVMNLADRLKSISQHLASAAEYGASTAHRLHGIANAQVAKIDDADPLRAESIETLQGINALTKLANSSAEIGINLLRANKEAAERAQEEEARRNKCIEQLPSDPISASKAYIDIMGG